MLKYLDPIISFLDKNDWISQENEFIKLQHVVVERIERDKVGFQIVQDILELMENYPLVEFGKPGPLTHFVESFYKKERLYVEQLEQSVARKPTVHTLWMLNRLINGIQVEKAQELMGLMNSISKNKTIDINIRKVAVFFLEP